MVGRSAIVLAAATLGLTACGGDSKKATAPCVVGTGEMASILDEEDVIAAPQKNGLECVYASQGDPLILLSVRTLKQFQAERHRFESGGFKLPPLDPLEGFDDDANVDPRYNSVNVTAGERVVSVQIMARDPSDPKEQLELEKRIARAALESL